MPLTTNYVYDAANRLASVDGVAYTWDNNGNLLSDGANSYAYNSANQLTAMSGPFGPSVFSYNGLGDRLSQNGVNYTLDLNAGRTQVLSDGTNQYLYGLGRIAENQGGVNEYYLGDALESVRQLTDAQGEITLARTYEPYGNLAQATGAAQTSYGFTGEWTDPSGLVYLRARYYAPEQGRFITRDPWDGVSETPATLNPYLYGLNNPTRYTDPSGENPLGFVVALAGVMGLGAVAGGIYGCVSYEWAVTGQCGCDIQQAASSMSKSEWVSMHMLLGGFTAGVASIAVAGATVAPWAAVAVGGVAIGIAVWDGINLLNVVYEEGVGWTPCNITRAALDLSLLIFGTTNLVSGLRAFRASGSWLKWDSPLPATGISPSQQQIIKPFLNIEGNSATGIRARIPSSWRLEFGYYSPKSGPPQHIPQYKFTSPDGLAELRIHGPQAPYQTSWVARIGLKVPEGTPGALVNPFKPGEFWLYFTNKGVPTSDMNAMGSIQDRK